RLNKSITSLFLLFSPLLLVVKMNRLLLIALSALSAIGAVNGYKPEVHAQAADLVPDAPCPHEGGSYCAGTYSSLILHCDAASGKLVMANCNQNNVSKSSLTLLWQLANRLEWLWKFRLWKRVC